MICSWSSVGRPKRVGVMGDTARMRIVRVSHTSCSILSIFFYILKVALLFADRGTFALAER